MVDNTQKWMNCKILKTISKPTEGEYEKLRVKIFLTFAFPGFGQSYVFCPELETVEKQGLSDYKI